MSRRTKEYRHCRGANVDETVANILYRHRNTKNIGRQYFVDQNDPQALLTDGTRVIYIPSSMPIHAETALRIAQALHHGKRA